MAARLRSLLAQLSSAAVAATPAPPSLEVVPPRRLLLSGNRMDPTADDVVPLACATVDGQVQPLPREIARVHQAIATAVASRNFREAALLQELLHVTEPKPLLSVGDCAPASPVAARDFFFREGFVCVPKCFSRSQLLKLQRAWRHAQAPASQLWEEARHFAGNFSGEDFKPQKRFAGFGHGRLFYDIPMGSFLDAYRKQAAERSRAGISAGGNVHGEDAAVLLDLTDPPPLMRVLKQVIGGGDVRLSGIQPRTVPPEDPGSVSDGGYTTWHRDGLGPPDQWPFPNERIVKVFVYLFDVAAEQGATAVVRGSHLLPWSPAGVYDMVSAGYSVVPGKPTGAFAGSGLGKGEQGGFAPLRSIPNHVTFAAKAGDAIVFDIATVRAHYNVMTCMLLPPFVSDRICGWNAVAYGDAKHVGQSTRVHHLLVYKAPGIRNSCSLCGWQPDSG